MIPYIVAVLFPLLIKYINKTNQNFNIDLADRKAEKRRIKWIYLAALPMFILIAFRCADIGPDTGVYRWMFTHIIDKDWSQLQTGERVEIGFLVFEKVVSLFTHDELIYQVIYTFIYYVSVVEFARNFKGIEFDFLYLFGTLGLYKFMFTGVRQCLAMCICLWSFKFIKKRKLILFIILVALAFTFHKSAILFIPAYFLYNRKKSLVTSLLMMLFIVALPFITPGLQTWMANILSYNYAEIESTQNGYLSFLCILIISIFAIIMISNQSSVEKVNDIWKLNNVSYLALAFWTMRLITRVAERPSYFSMFFTMAVFAYCLNLVDDGKSRIIIKLVAYSLAFLLFIYKMNSGLYVPYSFN